MHDGQSDREGVVFCLALLVGLIVQICVSRALYRRVDEGSMGRFRATFAHGLAAIPLAIVPVLFAVIVGKVAGLFGVALFDQAPGNQGALVGIGYVGMCIPMVATLLFAAVMVLKTGFALLDRAVAPKSAPAPRPSTGSRDLFADLPPPIPRVGERRDTAHR